ncbi:zinc metalloproteinase nas-13-like [Phymastichus coffea]|uniref:zinc metalloproteinase nas-13-like n=1 Tax=Phymastichus coffea TaxID=108790 RepID=UPI00273BD1EA|nr:zinc metalloproteinase nas-13-like [Phymastichus coffea]
MIKSAMEDVHESTCIRFKPRTGEQDCVEITLSEEGCSSYVGRIGGFQVLRLTPACVSNKGAIIHELMHVIGFYHEHSRPDRDKYVKILWDNIHEIAKFNFKKYDFTEVDTFGISYDYESIMHYPTYAFSRNGKPTIIVRKNKKMKIGQRQNLSLKDIKKIRKMYGCK